ncbi:MAG: DHHA1 domain-containing protein [archaeon]|nr:DHHA1 domain-containing protein [archaeon]
MLTPKQIEEIKNHLAKAQNPIFFFDNDADGLCSFLLLKRHLNRGKGVAVRSFPDLNSTYFRKVEELKSDYIFILDKPIVSKEFLKEAEENNIPVVWIDHHEVQEEIPNFVYYYNPMKNENKTNEPVTYLCFQLTKNKEDLWIAVAGCVSDKFVPEFYKEFEKTYPDLTVKYNDAFDIFYKSQIGKVIRIFNFGLKDRTTNVVNMLKFLIQIKSPYEVLEENQKNFSMHNRFKQIDGKYQKLLKKAYSVEKNSKKILFFQYGGDLSISSDIANELSYKFPNKVVVVAYISGVKANISVRGKKIREIVLKSIEGLENASGGGHEDAVGAQIKVEDIEKFRNSLENLIK